MSVDRPACRATAPVHGQARTRDGTVEALAVSRTVVCALQRSRKLESLNRTEHPDALRLARQAWRIAETGEGPAHATSRCRFDGGRMRCDSSQRMNPTACEIAPMLDSGIEAARREGRFEAWLQLRERAGGRT